MPTGALRPIIVFVALCMLAVTACARAQTPDAPRIDLTDPAKSYDVLAYADVLDDPNGAFDIDDVSRSPALRRTTSGPGASGDAHGAYGRGTADSQPPDDGIRWYRFRAAVPQRSAVRWYLTTSRWCSEADLYLPGDAGSYRLQRFGYRVPAIRHPAPGVVPAIDARGFDGRTAFVRLRCDRDLQSLFFESGDALAVQDVYPGFNEINTGVLFLALLATGLAVITRSPAFALAGLSGATAVTFGMPLHFAQWFPTLAMPPYWLLEDAGVCAFYITQWLFYDKFFELHAQRRRWRRTLAAAAMCAVFGTLAIDAFAPLRWFYAPPIEYVAAAFTDAFYCTAAALAVVVASKGNRSAWFVAAGIAVYLLVNVVRATVWAYELHAVILRLAFNFSVAVDLMLFILGVGDRLRQTSLAQQRALIEKDAAQGLLVAEQRNRIAEIERRNASFARFVPREFLHQLEKTDILDVGLGDHVERDMAIVFTDIRSFTSLAERLSPRETFDFLNAYLARAGPVIREHGGFIDKYVGDAIVALFPARASDALDAGIALQNEVRRFNEDRARRGLDPIAVGVGANFGRMMLGTIGERERYETTVIADSVNIASRLEGLTKAYGVSIVAGAALVDQLIDRNAYCLRPLGEVSLRGAVHTQTVYEVFDGDAHDLVLHKRRTRESFEEALASYGRGHYARSRDLFAQIAAAHPLDHAAAYLRDRSFVLTGTAVTGGEN